MNLELGGGVSPIKLRQVGMGDYVNIDAIDHPLVDIRHDLTIVPWPIKSGTVEAIYSSEFMEHISDLDTATILSESYRVLVPGGRFAFECPDFEGICKQFFKKGLSGSKRFYLRRGICGDQVHKWDIHKNVWTESYARKELKEHGFVRVKRYPAPTHRIDYRELPFDENFMQGVKLCIEAHKPK
jgi:predicted SAM-dependent methyltransferase